MYVLEIEDFFLEDVFLYVLEMSSCMFWKTDGLILLIASMVPVHLNNVPHPPYTGRYGTGSYGTGSCTGKGPT